MAWSKVSTTTGSFQGGVNSDLSVNNRAVIDEYMTFLETRGWVIDGEELNSETYKWKMYKKFVCNDGGTQDIGFAMYYYTAFSNGADEMRLYGMDIATEDVTASDPYMSMGLGASSNADEYVGGKWSFWVSDADSDSFIVMAEDSATDLIIGFWPPSGSLWRQGKSGDSRYNVLYTGVKPFWGTDWPCWEGAANTNNDGIEIGIWSESYMQLASNNTRKYDFVWATSEEERPLFRTFGGDIHMLINLSESPVVVKSSTLMPPVGIYLFEGKYWIAWGNDAKLLFDCGETQPVF